MSAPLSPKRASVFRILEWSINVAMLRSAGQYDGSGAAELSTGFSIPHRSVRTCGQPWRTRVSGFGFTWFRCRRFEYGVQGLSGVCAADQGFRGCAAAVQPGQTVTVAGIPPNKAQGSASSRRPPGPEWSNAQSTAGTRHWVPAPCAPTELRRNQRLRLWPVPLPVSRRGTNALLDSVATAASIETLIELVVCAPATSVPASIETSILLVTCCDSRLQQS
jgi:hypothetical protein